MKKVLIILLIAGLGAGAYYILSADTTVAPDVDIEEELGVEIDEEVEVADFEDIEIGDLTPEEEAEIAEIEAEVVKFNEIFGDATSTSEDCAEIENEELRTACEQSFIYSAAIEAGDKGMCNDLELEEDQEACKEDVKEQ